MGNNPLHMWADKYPLVNPSHADELNVTAGHHEFNSGLSREDAEKKTWGDYRKKQLWDALGHHFRGMTDAARDPNSAEDAKQHSTMYRAIASQLGVDPNGPVPKEIQNYRDPKMFKFKAHPATALLGSAGTQTASAPNAANSNTSSVQANAPLAQSEPPAEDLLEKSRRSNMTPGQQIMRKAKTCRCKAYKFPHRHKSGACGRMGTKQPSSAANTR